MRSKEDLTLPATMAIAKEVLHFRVTEEEARLISDAANKAGMSRSSFIRATVVKTLTGKEK